MLQVILAKVWYVIEMLLGIGLLIFVHELGHFLTCKRLGVKVLRFSIGFGPKLVGFRRGETEYVVGLVPFGGYVKMHGEDPREEEQLDERSFLTQPPGKKVLIAVSGSTMNALFALLFFVTVFSVGIHFPKGAVGYVYPDSPADKAGLQEGDEITEIEGRKHPDFDDIRMLIALSNPRKGVRLKLKRQEQELEQLVYPEYDPEIGAQVVGFEAPISLELAGVNKDSPAEKAGLMEGDRIVSVDGKEPRGGTEIYELINASPDKPLRLVVERKEKQAEAKLIEVELTPESVYRYDAGVRCTLPPEVLEVGPLSPADRAGLKAGDRIVSIDGRLIRTWSELTEITSRSADKPLSLVVDRSGASVSLVVTPRRRPDDWRARMGIIQPEAVIGEVLPGSPAAQAGVMSGDRVLGVSWTIEERIPGESDSPGAAQEVTMKEVQLVCDSWGIVEEVVQQRGAQPITFVIDRGGTRHEPVLTPERTDEVMTAYAGFVPQPEQVLRKYSLPRACLVGFRKAVLWGGSAYLTLRRILITRSMSARKSIGGPVAIFALSYQFASMGMVKFLYWLGMLGVWFAVFNLLPVPILDGGHIVVAAVEKIKGSRLSERTLILVQLTGLVLIVSLMVLVTLNDILRMPKYFGR